MPDVVTHYYFGRELLKRLPLQIQEQIDSQSLYDFATAGPDPFFFVYFLNKEKQNQSHAFGNYMHVNQVSDFFTSLAKEAKNNHKMFAYLCGFLAHFALDVYCHPYVFYYTGVYKKEDPSTHEYRGLHTKLERAIDSDIIKKKFHKNPSRFKIHKEVLKLKKLDPTLKESFDEVYRVFGKEDGFDHVNKSVRYQRKFYKFLYDPFGIKQKLFEKLDNGSSSLDLTVLSYYKKSISSVDIYNQAHKTWRNPANQDLASTDSFLDLMEKAGVFAKELIEKSYGFVFLNKDVSLKTMFPNLSYLTGLDLREHQEMTVFKNIFSSK